MRRRWTKSDRPPRLVPTGSVDDVLLTGKNKGKDLTLFQSIGLAVWGLLVLLGMGVPFLVPVFGKWSVRGKAGDRSSIELGILMCLLGGAWIVMGLMGAAKAAKAKKRSSPHANRYRF